MGSRAMTEAFGKAAAYDRLDKVMWHEGVTFTANLKQANLDIMDPTKVTLTYELYAETRLEGEFTLKAKAELMLVYESFDDLTVERYSILKRGLTEGWIRNDGKVYLQRGSILGLVGEEEAVEQYLKERNNGRS